MADLSVDFVGMHFPNPFMLASAPPTRTAEMIKRAFAAGWGGAVTKSIAPDPAKDLQPRLQTLRHRRRNIGMENVESTTQLTVQDWQREIADIKAAYPDRPLWASIMDAPVEEGRPAGRPSGIRHVFLNGRQVVRDSAFIEGSRAGRVLRT